MSFELIHINTDPGRRVVGVIGGGDLDDLQAATAEFGFKKAGNVYRLDYTTTGELQILIMGHLAETRSGVRHVQIGLNAHICWAFSNGTNHGDTVFGRKTLDGNFLGSVHVVWEQNSRFLFDDAWGNDSHQSYSHIGKGRFRGVSGSMHTEKANTRFQIWGGDIADPSFAHATFDDFTLSGVHSAVIGYNPTPGRYMTTDRTRFIFEGHVVSKLPATTGLYSQSGLYNLGGEPNNVTHLRYRSSVATTDSLVTTNFVDAASRYVSNVAGVPDWHGGPKIMYRTLKINFLDENGISPYIGKISIQNAVTGNTQISVPSSGYVEHLIIQSSKLNEVAHNGDGTQGWRHYDVYIVVAISLGHSKFWVIDPLGHYGDRTQGISLFYQSSRNSAYDGTLHGEIVSAPFSFDMSTRQLTVTAPATAQQAANYLLRLCYDNPHGHPVWAIRNYRPVTKVDDYFVFNQIGIVGCQHLTGKIKTSLGAFAEPSTPGELKDLHVDGNLSIKNIMSMTNVSVTGSLINNETANKSVVCVNSSFNRADALAAFANNARVTYRLCASRVAMPLNGVTLQSIEPVYANSDMLTLQQLKDGVEELGQIRAIYEKLPSGNKKIAGEGVVAKNLDEVSGGSGGGGLTASQAQKLDNISRALVGDPVPE